MKVRLALNAVYDRFQALALAEGLSTWGIDCRKAYGAPDQEAAIQVLLQEQRRKKAELERAEADAQRANARYAEWRAYATPRIPFECEGLLHQEAPMQDLIEALLPQEIISWEALHVAQSKSRKGVLCCIYLPVGEYDLTGHHIEVVEDVSFHNDGFCQKVVLDGELVTLSVYMLPEGRFLWRFTVRVRSTRDSGRAAPDDFNSHNFNDDVNGGSGTDGSSVAFMDEVRWTFVRAAK